MISASRGFLLLLITYFARRQWLDEQHGPGSGAAMLAENAAEEAAAAAALSVKRVGTMDDLQCLDEELEAVQDRAGRYGRLSAHSCLHYVSCLLLRGKHSSLVCLYVSLYCKASGSM